MLRIGGTWMMLPPGVPFLDGLQEIARIGYEGVELGVTPERAAKPWDEYRDDPDRLKRELHTIGLRLSGIYVGTALHLEDRAAADIDRALAIARYLAEFGHEERNLIVGPGARRPDAHGLLNSEYDRLAEGLDRLGRACADLGVACLFHPHAGSCIERRHEIDHLLRLTDPRYVGLCLDTGHVYTGGTEPHVIAREHGAILRYLHLKDFDDGSYCDLGTGEIDHSKLFDAIRDLGFSGWIVPEIPTRGRDPIASARGNHEFVRRHLLEGHAASE